MLVKISKALDRYENNVDPIRSNPDEYLIEVQFKEKNFSYSIDVGKNKTQIVPERKEVLSSAPYENYQIANEMENVLTSSYPYSLADIFTKPEIVTTFGLEKSVTGDIDVTISSDFSELLETDWEIILKKSFGDELNFIHKRSTTPSKGRQPIRSNGLNTLVLLSYAYKFFGDTHDKISGYFENEAQKIFSSFFSNFMRNRDKPNTLTIARYINRNSINSLALSNYDVLHISAHGKPGKIGIESIDNSEEIDWLESNSFDLLSKQGHKFKIIFLATCNGANNLSNSGSVAMELIRNGIAEVVIAFLDGAGAETSIPSFVKLFYEFLLSNKNPEEAFRESVIRMKRSEKTIKLLPIYYTSNE
jgi:hypothetical protein